MNLRALDGYEILASEIVRNPSGIISFVNSNTNYSLAKNATQFDIQLSIADNITDKSFVKKLDEYLSTKSKYSDFVCGGVCIAGIVVGIGTAVTAITKATKKSVEQSQGRKRQELADEYALYQNRKQQRDALKREEDAIKDRFLESLMVVQKEIQDQYNKEQLRTKTINNLVTMLLVGSVVVVVPILIYRSRKK